MNAIFILSSRDRQSKNIKYLNTHCYKYLTSTGYWPIEWMQWQQCTCFLNAEELRSCDYIMLPIQLPGHWLLARINMKEKIIEITVDNVKRYIELIFEDVGEITDASSWESKDVRHACERQPNYYDCGLHVIWNCLCLKQFGAPMAFPVGFRGIVKNWLVRGDVSMIDIDNYTEVQ